jgi:uncharacterized protein (DUF1499 family)
MSKWKKVLIILVAAAAAVGLGIPLLRALVDLISPRPDNLGVRNGELAPCPSYPNCVSTQAEDETHAIDPIPYTGSTAAARQRIVDIVNSMERSRVITVEPTYIYVEFRTPGLRYTDDVEFTFDEEARLIHFRSAARLPYYDFNVNRERMETIRSEFQR